MWRNEAVFVAGRRAERVVSVACESGMPRDDTLENVRVEELCEVLMDSELAVVFVTS